MRNKILFAALTALALTCTTSCGSKGGETATSDSTVTDTAAFDESQPVASGQYDATAYDITGPSARSGKFDGRMLIALSPEQSALYVYENGNRAKIDYKVVLERPFEKNDSGVYVSADSKGKPVTISTDSTFYTLTFDKNESKIRIDFDKTPKSTGTAMEVLEKITSMIQNGK